MTTSLSNERAAWLILWACAHPSKAKRILSLEDELGHDSGDGDLARTRGLQLAIFGESPPDAAAKVETNGHDSLVAHLQKAGLEPVAKYLHGAMLFDWLSGTLASARLSYTAAKAVSHQEVV